MATGRDLDPAPGGGPGRAGAAGAEAGRGPARAPAGQGHVVAAAAPGAYRTCSQEPDKHSF